MIAALCLGGCVTHDPDAGSREVAVSCVSAETPKAPIVHTPQQLARAADGPTRFTMAGADYLALYAWMLQASPALEGCRKAGGP